MGTNEPVAIKEVPDHAPPHLVTDIDLYDPPGADRDFHGAWRALQYCAPDIVCTTANGVYRIALRAGRYPWSQPVAGK